MAGFTHSAFRRLVADFGGYGALFTEMLSGRWLLHENLHTSPAVRRREEEGRVIYQLMVGDPAEVPRLVDRLARVAPCGLDLNCACPAPNVRSVGAGSDLFEDRDRLTAIVGALRRHYPGLLSVKIRLGRPGANWRERLLDRLRLFEDHGVDAVILHPRFSDEKLKRRARHELFPELAAATRLPLIASGDIHGPQVVREHPHHFAAVAGIMVGRMAVVQPWLFRAWDGGGPGIDYLEVWRRFCRYALEDFGPGRAYYRIKAFTSYYARNFVFGHTLFTIAQSAPDLPSLTDRAAAFLAASPPLARNPNAQGLD
jgi:tRNA-dihydrouridine synthase B